MEHSKFDQGTLSTKVSTAGAGGTGGKSQWSIGNSDEPDDRWGNNNKVGDTAKPSAPPQQQ